MRFGSRALSYVIRDTGEPYYFPVASPIRVREAA